MKLRCGMVVRLWLEHNCSKGMNWIVLDNSDLIKVQCEYCGQIVLLTKEQFSDFYLDEVSKSKATIIKNRPREKRINNRKTDEYICDLKAHYEQSKIYLN